MPKQVDDYESDFCISIQEWHQVQVTNSPDWVNTFGELDETGYPPHVAEFAKALAQISFSQELPDEK